MKEILFSVISSNKFYEFVSMFLASLAAEQLFSISEDKKWYWRVLIYVFGYLGCLLVALFIYALVQHFRVHAQLFLTMWRFGQYIFRRYFISFIAVPLTVRAANWLGGIYLKDVYRILVVIICVGGIFGASFLPTNHSEEATIEMDDSFLYAAKFYDVESFEQRAKNGWYDPQTLLTLDEGQKDIAADEAEELPAEPIEEMDFNTAVYSAITFYDGGYYDEATQCIDRAYALYLEGYAADNWYIARMWWYKGDLENNLECFLNAADVFGEDDDYYNAAVSYQAAYNLAKLPEYAESTLAQYLSYVSSDEDVTEKKLDVIIDFLYSVYNDTGAPVPYLENFSALYPENLCIQMLSVVSRVSDMDVSDLETMESFLSLDKYANSPKLLITRDFYYFEQDMSYYVSMEEIYTLYQEHSDFFEPEDLVNAAGLFYALGEYEKAYAFVETGVLPEACLLNAELYLRDQDIMPAEDAMRLYRQMVTGSDAFTSWYDGDSGVRYEIVKAYLANRVGAWNEDTNEMSAAFLMENYAECVRLCDEALEEDAGNVDILLLKSDALVMLAIDEEDEETSEGYLVDAETALLAIRDLTEGDYISSLDRLKSLYERMRGRDELRQEVNDILRVME